MNTALQHPPQSDYLGLPKLPEKAPKGVFNIFERGELHIRVLEAQILHYKGRIIDNVAVQIMQEHDASVKLKTEFADVDTEKPTAHVHWKNSFCLQFKSLNERLKISFIALLYKRRQQGVSEMEFGFAISSVDEISAHYHPRNRHCLTLRDQNTANLAGYVLVDVSFKQNTYPLSNIHQNLYREIDTIDQSYKKEAEVEQILPNIAENAGIQLQVDSKLNDQKRKSEYLMPQNKNYEIDGKGGIVVIQKPSQNTVSPSADGSPQRERFLPQQNIVPLELRGLQFTTEDILKAKDLVIKGKLEKNSDFSSKEIISGPKVQTKTILALQDFSSLDGLKRGSRNKILNQPHQSLPVIPDETLTVQIAKPVIKCRKDSRITQTKKLAIRISKATLKEFDIAAMYAIVSVQFRDQIQVSQVSRLGGKMDLKNIIWDDEFLFPVNLSVENDEIVKILLYSIQMQYGDKKEHHLPKYSLLGECEEPYSLFCHKSGIKQWMQVAPSLRKSDSLLAVSKKSQVKKPSLGSLLVWSKLMYEEDCDDMKQNQTEIQELRQEILGQKHYLTTIKAIKRAQQSILPPISISGSVTRGLINDFSILDSSTISIPPTLGHSPSQCNSNAPSPPFPQSSQQFFPTQLNSPTEVISAVKNGLFSKKNYEKRKSNLERIYSRMDITDNNKLDFVPKEK